MNDQILVSADGYVHTGFNNWASLEAIQRAVEAKQNPEANEDDRQGQMEHRVKNEHVDFQQELERIDREEREAREQAEVRRRAVAARVHHMRQTSNEQEPLEMPSTMPRKVNNHKEQLQTLNFDREDQDEHLRLPSTFQKRA